jgi:hypothetical protein
MLAQRGFAFLLSAVSPIVRGPESRNKRNRWDFSDNDYFCHVFRFTAKGQWKERTLDYLVVSVLQIAV